MFKRYFFWLLLMSGILMGSSAQAENPLPINPIKSSNIRNGGTYDTPTDIIINWEINHPGGACLSGLAVWLEVDGVETAKQIKLSTDFIASGGSCRHGLGQMTFSLNLSPGQHSIALRAFDWWWNNGYSVMSFWPFASKSVTIRPPIPVPTILVNGSVWGGRVPTTDSPFTLQVTGTNNPTQCFMQTTNALNQTNGYQSFPCDRYLTPKSVRPSDFNFTEGVNAFHVYMENAYGTSKTAVNWATVASLPEATVLLNGKADDVTVSTPSSPFRLQITGTNNPTHCYMDTGNNSDFEFPCDKYANETTVLPSDFGFADEWNQMRVWVENDNGESDWVIRTVFIHPIPEVTLLLNGASQDIRVPSDNTPFTLQITGTNNPQQCYMKAVNSLGQNDYYQNFWCGEYTTPQTVRPGDHPFFFQDGVNTIQVYMENQYGDASDEVAHTVSIGTFRPSVSFLLNGLPQDLVLATATSPFDMYVSWDNNPTSCYESRKSPLALVWGPYNKLQDRICTVEGLIEGAGVSPLALGLQTGVNGIRYYVSNSAGNSDVVTRYITVPPPVVNTLALCTESGLTPIATGTATRSRNLYTNASEGFRAFYDSDPTDCAGTEVTTGWAEPDANTAVSISGNGTTPQIITAGPASGTENVTLTQGADTITLNYTIHLLCTPNCTNASNVCAGTVFSASNCGSNNCTGTKNCNYNFRESSP